VEEYYVTGVTLDDAIEVYYEAEPELITTY
jgi:hypothetical protein